MLFVIYAFYPSSITVSPYKNYREDFNSLDEVTAPRFTPISAPLAMRHMRILPMNQLITFGIK
jgi:hypothetical protein